MAPLSPDDVTRALALARTLALEAGAMLRQEFHRPDGPRGDGAGVALIDVEVERLVRARLEAAFPTFGYVGEETGRREVDGAPTWLLDPNDGTRGFNRGFRGSSVSLALVHRGQPVLAVIHAPLAPDDGGDTFTWAVGHPFSRNGREVHRPPLPEELEPHHVVLVSQAGEADPVLQTRLAAPARYRTLPSVAYRLALTAAGDGDACVSVSNPTHWDVAAGHAFLKAVGGVLLGADARPLGHGPSDPVGNCFGGHPRAAAALASGEWAALHTAWTTGKATFKPELAYPRRGQAIAEPELLSRIHGCWLGQLVGDALGSQVEFQSAAALQARHPGGLRTLSDGGTFNTLAGQPTDDSELALALARTLLTADGHDDEAVRAAYVRWLDSHPFDVGNTIRGALRGRPDTVSQANGALMRASPLALRFLHRTDDEVAAVARKDARLTHAHPVCQDANAVYCVALRHALATGASGKDVYRHALGWARRAGLQPSVLQALDDAATSPPRAFEGWVLNALQNAFFRLLHSPSLEEGLVDTVMQGADADTNACVAGALLGAVHGREAIPLRWRLLVLTCRPLETTRRPRPRWLWPVDALELAERLALAG